VKIFFSYPHDANAPLVQRIRADLEARGHEVWLDASEIKAGDDWRDRITRGILDSERIVAFLSKHGTRDPGVCLNEIAIALAEKGEHLVSVLVEPEDEVRAPVSITHLQFLRMEDWAKAQERGGADWEGWYRKQVADLVAVLENPRDAGCQWQPKSPQARQSNSPHPVHDSVVSSARTRPALSFSLSR
jgi:hypothetical protein